MKDPAVPHGRPSRAVVVHGQAQAAIALRAAAGGSSRLVLLSAPGAACYLGAGWWLAILDALRTPMRAQEAEAMLDCGLAAGRAMEALRLGLRGLILSPECAQFDAVQGRAAALDARLNATRPPALDLGEAHAERRLRGWLGSGVL